MCTSKRRVFVLQLASVSMALSASRYAMAQAAELPLVDPKDPLAGALGYAEDASTVDAAKFPQHAKDQVCAGCQLYTGKPGEKTGPCGIFVGKRVSSGGWCVSFVKRAG